MTHKYQILVIGGGAAGFFAALSAKKKNPELNVAILEKNSALLSKVRVSGGGRCNATHACFDPKMLVKNYPRGHKELLGPLYQFQPKDTVEWFEARGVTLKTESDGRMFPTTDSSDTIIECLLNEAKELGVSILTKVKIETVKKTEEEFYLTLKDGSKYCSRALILATGSSAAGHLWATELGHKIVNPVPSLFTFNVPNSPLSSLSGASVPSARVKISGTNLSQTGPLLITHFGFSGPAVLKLSAWAARELHDKNYDFEISINWTGELQISQALEELKNLKDSSPKKLIVNENLFSFPKKLWRALLKRALISDTKRVNDLSLKECDQLAKIICSDCFDVKGKTTNKEEFVTCGGVSLKEVNFKTMESKICKKLFFAGEVLDIDGVTGGFNFQNAWTTGYIAGQNC